jgi:hypothetical protein
MNYMNLNALTSQPKSDEGGGAMAIRWVDPRVRRAQAPMPGKRPTKIIPSPYRMERRWSRNASPDEVNG